MTSVIIDDEAKSHEVLKQMLLKDHPEVEILASGESVSDGYQIIQEHQPELVFLDIEMPDGTGFDLLQKIGPHKFQVIFITAFNQYAITAIRFGALDYLLKPIYREDLDRSVRMAYRKRQLNGPAPEQLEILWETLQNARSHKPPTRIAISTHEGIHFKMVDNIIRLEARQNYTNFILEDHHPVKGKVIRQLLASLNIKRYEEQFEPDPAFMRVHRSHLVNLQYVDTYVRSDGGYLVLKDGSEVNVSTLYKEELLARMEAL